MDNFNNQFLNELDSTPVSNKLAQVMKKVIISSLEGFDKKLEDMKATVEKLRLGISKRGTLINSLQLENKKIVRNLLSTVTANRCIYAT